MKNYLPITLSNYPESNSSKEDKMEGYINEAKSILKKAGDDVEKQTEAISDIATQLVSYNNPLKMMRYVEQLAKEFKIKRGDFTLAIKEAKITKKGNLETNEETSALVTRVEQFITKKYDIYFNIIANKFMYREHGQNEFREINEDNIYRDLQKAHIRYSMSDLKSLLKSDFVSKQNVFFKYFQNLPPWDGEDHIKKLIEYIKVREISNKSNEQDRFFRMFQKMLIRSVACCLEADFNKQCFTIVDEKQNSGKSTFLRWLCPPFLQDYYTENIGTSKDDLIALTENFIVNIDELSTLSKYDINALKSVMSKHRVKVRLPYGDRPELLQRRCNFVASTNRLEFLNDETGSVRWVCFLLDRIEWSQETGIGIKNYKTDIDINKVWSQAYYLFNLAQSGRYNYQLTPLEIEENENANKTFLIRSPEIELIMKYFVLSSKSEYDRHRISNEIFFRTATDILNELNQKNIGNIKLNSINVGKALKILGFIQDSRYQSDMSFSIKGYYLKYREIENNHYDDNLNDETESSNEPEGINLPF